MIEARDAIGVEIRIAKQLLTYAHAFDEEADIKFVSHPDAAMHLDAFLRRESRALRGPSFGYRDDLSSSVERFIECLQRLQNRRAGHFQVAVEIRSAMLQGLELANQFPELLAFLKIGQSSSEGFVTGAQQL